jgi:hypothetical protein
VSPFQLGAALVVLAGALVALSARDIRFVLGGLGVAVSAAGLVADPLPSPLALACRIVAVLLGIELVLVAVRGRIRETGGSPLGPVGPALAGAAAFIIAYAASGLGSSAASPADFTTIGPSAATAAGFALATLALGPVLLGRDLLRIGVGVTLLVTATALVRAGLAGTPASLEQLAWAALTVAVLGVTAILAGAALAVGPSLLIDDGAPRTTLFEAHRLTGTLAGPLARLPGGTRASSADPQAGSVGRRRPGGSHPAGAHQLTLEERLHRTPDPAGGGLASGEPAVSQPVIAETVEAEPVEAEPDGDLPG